MRMRERVMSHLKFYLSLLFFCIYLQSKIFDWAVIGAGPAGIICTTFLLEHNIPGDKITWIDPEFNAGRLGKFYQNVPSNSKAHKYTDFLNSCGLFKEINADSFAKVKEYNQDQEPFLQLIIDPLHDITQYLAQKVNTSFDMVKELIKEDDCWRLELSNNFIYAHKVILATGSSPKRFNYPEIKEIPLDFALDFSTLKTLVSSQDTVIVVGSLHSALLIVKYLSEIPVKKVINIFNKQPQYGPLIGLQGITAHWTEEILEKNPPKNIIRAPWQEGIIDAYKSQCTKIIYAFGFERNTPLVNGSKIIDYDIDTGIIQPNLYGIGIAFPEKCILSEGESTNLIGLNAFVKRTKACMPYWIKQ